ncbi:MAG: ABC transporter permease [Oscillospiraceae bacterium]
MKAIYERELKSWFSGMMGYAVVAFILLFGGIYTMALNLHAQYAGFQYVLNNMVLIFMVVTPLLTMRAIAEERRQKTDQLLYALPIGMSAVVVGKYLAMITVLFVPLAMMGFYPLLLSAYGTVPMAASYGTLLAFFLMGAALIAMGLFVSSLTDNQAVAAVGCLIVTLINYFLSPLASFVPGTASASLAALTLATLVLGAIVWLLTKHTLAACLTVIVCEGALVAVRFAAPAAFEGLFSRIMGQLSVFERFFSFMNGIFDVTALVYFVTVIAVFLFLTVQSLEKRRWS